MFLFYSLFFCCRPVMKIEKKKEGKNRKGEEKQERGKEQKDVQKLETMT